MGLSGDSGRSNAEQVNRTELSFRLPEGLIVAVGLTEVAPQDWKIKARQPSQRVILGGDGPLCRRSWSPVHRPPRRQQL